MKPKQATSEPTKRQRFELDIVAALETGLDCSTSDAQSILEASGAFYVAQGWAGGASPADVAAKIIASGSSGPSSTPAQAFANACITAGFTFNIKGANVVSVSKSFEPGDNAAFVSCDMIAPGLLDMVPLRGGSVWGTDGAGIGGMIARKNGSFTLNKSGTGAGSFLRDLSKLVQ